MTSVSVFTLNCWGIGMGVSRDRVVRMRAIGQHLADTDYDIVCLQEVWCPEDFQTITSLARDSLPFHHFFDHGIIGSGTAILCKVPVVDAAFHEFSLNGYPHKILHGDWFAGKGIGVCNIDFKVCVNYHATLISLRKHFRVLTSMCLCPIFTLSMTEVMTSTLATE